MATLTGTTTHTPGGWGMAWGSSACTSPSCFFFPARPLLSKGMMGTNVKLDPLLVLEVLVMQFLGRHTVELSHTFHVSTMCLHHRCHMHTIPILAAPMTQTHINRHLCCETHTLLITCCVYACARARTRARCPCMCMCMCTCTCTCVCARARAHTHYNDNYYHYDYYY